MRKSLFFLAVPALLAIALLAVGCAGLSGTNVGEPTPRTQQQFHDKLSLLHTGMSVDSLELIFQEVREPGEAGILHRSKVITSDFVRVRYSLGWKSDPRHQIGYKEIDEIDVELASVIAEDSRLVLIEKHE